MRKRGLSTVDTPVPVIATTVSVPLYLWGHAPRQGDLDLDIGPHRNQILPRGHRRGARQLSVLPDLYTVYLIESASSHWEMTVPVHNKRTYVDCVGVHDCLPSSELFLFEIQIGRSGKK